jgi:hypothetical protein
MVRVAHGNTESKGGHADYLCAVRDLPTSGDVGIRVVCERRNLVCGEPSPPRVSVRILARRCHISDPFHTIAITASAVDHFLFRDFGEWVA